MPSGNKFMQILDIIPREIHVGFEVSSNEALAILDFIEKAKPLYAKVHSDVPIDGSLSVIEEFEQHLNAVKEALEKEINANGSPLDRQRSEHMG